MMDCSMLLCSEDRRKGAYCPEMDCALLSTALATDVSCRHMKPSRMNEPLEDCLYGLHAMASSSTAAAT